MSEKTPELPADTIAIDHAERIKVLETELRHCAKASDIGNLKHWVSWRVVPAVFAGFIALATVICVIVTLVITIITSQPH